MINVFKALKRFYLRNRVSDFEFSQVSSEIYKANHRITIVCSFMSSLVFFGLSAYSLIFGQNLAIRSPIYYIPLFISQTIICFLSFKLPKEKIKYSLILLYAFIFTLCIYTLAVGVINHKDGYAVMIIVLEFGAPMIFIDKVKRIFSLSFMWVVIFCILTTLVKEPKYSRVDVFNCIIFYFLSLVPGFYIMKIKIREFSLRQIVESERDTDSLTRLLNKAAMIREIKRLMITSKNGILIILDLDYFKQINDTYGHFVGDNVLKLVSDRIRQTFRSSDVLSRFGGDEFVIFMGNTFNTEIAENKCNNLLKALNETKIFENDPNNLTTIHASFGYALYDPETVESYEILFQNADDALYQAKNEGKDCVRQFTLDSIPEL